MTHMIKTALLLTLLSVLLLMTGQLLGGQAGLKTTFILMLAMNLGSYWFSDSIVLKMHRAVPITQEQAPEIFKITEELAAQANIPMPKLYWISSASPNAFATGRNPKHAAVALTQGLVQSLNQDELRGVIAHELGHVIHRDTLTSTMIAVIAGTISHAAMMLRWSLAGQRGSSGGRDQQANPILLLLFAVLMPLAAAMIRLAVSRTREYAADDKGAELSGNPLYLASALQKISIGARKAPMPDANPAAAHLFIVSPLFGANFNSLFATHPPVEKRIARLEAMARA
ncbi:MAG TPA: zinc metalloprotease HtpX [Candidatus Omnitrophota bacterium]|nr:protease HtpX [Candidatus Omnitrophota bacterium]HRK61821.1 zinc metalloprotease HtpX [Candidatus Omnitrophota bacterium]